MEPRFSSFNVRGDAWGLGEMQTLMLYLWSGTSKLPGNPADASSRPWGASHEHKEACPFVMGRVASKMEIASVSIRKALAE